MAIPSEPWVLSEVIGIVIGSDWIISWGWGLGARRGGPGVLNVATGVKVVNVAGIGFESLIVITCVGENINYLLKN